MARLLLIRLIFPPLPSCPTELILLVRIFPSAIKLIKPPLDPEEELIGSEISISPP